MNYATIREHDVANGEGIRVSLFVSGCRHQCKECFNEVAWDFHFWKKYTKEQEDFIVEKLSAPYYAGLSVLGGEPLEPETQEDIASLIKRVKETYPKQKIWLYTWFTYEQIQNDMIKKPNKFPFIQDIIKNIDIMVDGKFVVELKNLSLAFRGSANQRVINVPESLKQERIVKYIE